MEAWKVIHMSTFITALFTKSQDTETTQGSMARRMDEEDEGYDTTAYRSVIKKQ